MFAIEPFILDSATLVYFLNVAIGASLACGLGVAWCRCVSPPVGAAATRSPTLCADSGACFSGPDVAQAADVSGVDSCYAATIATQRVAGAACPDAEGAVG